MSTNTKDTYLAVFLGSKTSPRMKAWMSLPEAERRAKEQEGIAAWKAWAEKHHEAVSAMGGPLGKTKKITERAIEDVSNEMGAFMVVRAESPHEAAAKLFEKHPHFTIFPGKSCRGHASSRRYRAVDGRPSSQFHRRTNHHAKHACTLRSDNRPRGLRWAKGKAPAPPSLLPWILPVLIRLCAERAVE